MGSKAPAEQGHSQEDEQSGLPAGDSRQTRPGSVPGVAPGNGAAISFALPKKKPRVVQAEQSEDQRWFTVVPFRAAKDKRLGKTELRVLMMVCAYANKGGLAWVGQERVAGHLGVSRRRVGQCMQKLTDCGYLRVTHKGYPGQRAFTRQVIFRDSIDADEAAAIAGELAPAQLRQQEKQYMDANKPKRKPGRPRKEKTYQEQGTDSLPQSRGEDGIRELVDLNILIAPEIAAAARERAATRAGVSPEQVSEALIHAELRRMLE